MQKKKKSKLGIRIYRPSYKYQPKTILFLYTLTWVCVRALPVGHLWSQANRRVWSLSCWILLRSTVSYRKYLFQVRKFILRWQNFITTNFRQLKLPI